MKNLFSEIPRLRGDNIEIRKLELNDAAALRKLIECDEVYRYLPTDLFEKKYANTEYTISRLYNECIKDSLILGIFLNGEFCGLTEIYGYRASRHKVSLGCRLLPAFWGKGIGSEALRLTVNYLFGAADIKVITASVVPENKASAQVLEKNGFRCAMRSVPEDWGHKKVIKSDRWIRKAKDYKGTYEFQ